MGGGRRGAHKRPPWPERVLHDHSGSIIHGLHPAPRRNQWATTALAVVVALALAAAVLGILQAVGVTGDESSPSAPRPGATSTASSSPTSSTDDGQGLQSCRELWSLQQDVLTAARPAMRQWDTHIAAMNQLVAGEITLAQANVFWDRTRIGAARRIQTFDQADRRLRSTAGTLCPVADSPPADASPGLQACLGAVDASGATLEAARTTMTTWRHHVHDMEQLRMGKLSPVVAQQLWLQTWKQGVRELRAYDRQDREAAQVRCQS